MSGDDRPMHEYESALNEAVNVLAEAVCALGVDRERLAAAMEERAGWFQDQGLRNGEAVLKHIANHIRDPEAAYIPRPPN